MPVVLTITYRQPTSCSLVCGTTLVRIFYSFLRPSKRHTQKNRRGPSCSLASTASTVFFFFEIHLIHEVSRWTPTGYCCREDVGGNFLLFRCQQSEAFRDSAKKADNGLRSVFMHDIQAACFVQGWVGKKTVAFEPMEHVRKVTQSHNTRTRDHACEQSRRAGKQ